MRFIIRKSEDLQKKPDIFQFSLWDSVNVIVNPCSSPFLLFQFSLWDSCCRGLPGSGGHSWKSAFNSLYEIRTLAYTCSSCMDSLAFNSLYEIRISIQGCLRWLAGLTFNSLYEILADTFKYKLKYIIKLSILSMRFERWPIILLHWLFMTAFNSLYEIPYCFLAF